MLKRLSLKVKIIIFVFFSILAMLILINVSIKNKQNIKKLEHINDVQKAQIIKEEVREKKYKKDILLQKYHKGYEAFNNKKYKEAIKLENEVIKEDVNFYKAYNVKGIALCYDNQFKEGMKNIDISLKLSPKFGYARFNKALAYELYGDYDEALKWYDNALEVEKYIWSYYGKASIYGRRGDVLNTVKYLKLAIDIDEVVKEEAKTEADFDPVRNSQEFQNLIR